MNTLSPISHLFSKKMIISLTIPYYRPASILPLFSKVRSSHRMCSITKVVLTNLAKFAAKRLRLRTLLKKRLAQVFFCEFCKISKNTFFTEHLWAHASKKCMKDLFIISFQIILKDSSEMYYVVFKRPIVLTMPHLNITVMAKRAK